MKRLAVFLVLGLIFLSCDRQVRIDGSLGTDPGIYPDYAGVTIPSNIAPLNFSYLGDGEVRLLVEGAFGTRWIKSRKGLFSFGLNRWRKMLDKCKGSDLTLTVVVKKEGRWQAFNPFSITVSDSQVDPYLAFRLLPPGYQGWYEMGIYQRDLESYSQKAIYRNVLTQRNCVNCHSFRDRDPGNMLFHARERFAGTVMVRDGEVRKLNTKTDSTISALVYPYWHPSGKYVAFSVNETHQSFFNHDPNRIEVFDAASDVVVLDTETNEIAYSPLTRSPEAFETFPTFSPDGRSLYFCSAKAVSPMPKEYSEVKYSLCRISFDPESFSFGDTVDTLYSAPLNGKSVSFPRISPDGKLLVFTLSGYGNFSIWHKDADLWAADLESGEPYPLDRLNSENVESYHSWSGNSKWLVFSSRRGDGLYTRPYLACFGPDGKPSKPFLLPQRNPLKYYSELMVSFNIPEFVSGKVRVGKHRISSVLRNTEGTNVTVKAE
ncbi:MAG: PD40 domain-containing protein [Bacteroidales bacterium]|nr:PD40 domain-containing protein [Bacteroidales bacterium]